MDTRLHSRDKGTIKIVGFWRRTGSEKGEDDKIVRQATVFWNACGILYTDYLKKGQTITGGYFASLFHWLSEEIKKKTSLF